MKKISSKRLTRNKIALALKEANGFVGIAANKLGISKCDLQSRIESNEFLKILLEDLHGLLKERAEKAYYEKAIDLKNMKALQAILQGEKQQMKDKSETEPEDDNQEPMKLITTVPRPKRRIEETPDIPESTDSNEKQSLS